MFLDRHTRGYLFDAATDAAGGGATPEAIKAIVDSALEGLTAKFTADTNAYDKKLEKHVQKALAPFAATLADMQKNMGGNKKLKKALRRLEEAQAAGAATQTPEQKAAAAAAAAAAGVDPEKAARKAAKKARKAAEQAGDRTADPFRKQQADATEARILALETDKAAALARTLEAEKEAALDRALSDMPWESLNARNLARMNYLPHVKKNDDGDGFLIGGEKLEKFIQTEIAEKYPILLQARVKGGSGATKGTTGKAPVIDFDNLTATTPAADLFAAAKALGTALGG